MILSINNKINITLCGMMGSGKSTVGKILAKKLKYEFKDIDKIIEAKANKSINRIFEEEGEKYFRDLEEKTTIEILQNEKTVISLGGGAIVNENIKKYIKKNSYNIYLNVNIDILKKRLENSKSRPLIKTKNLHLTLTNLIKNRENLYKKADLIIINEKNISATIEIILKNIINE